MQTTCEMCTWKHRSSMPHHPEEKTESMHGKDMAKELQNRQQNTPLCKTCNARNTEPQQTQTPLTRSHTDVEQIAHRSQWLARSAPIPRAPEPRHDGSRKEPEESRSRGKENMPPMQQRNKHDHQTCLLRLQEPKRE